MIAVGAWSTLAVALVLDAAVGDPDWLWRRTGHPVTWIGRLVDLLDRHWNRTGDSRLAGRLWGCAALLALVVAAAAAGMALEFAFAAIPFGWLGTALVVAVLIAGRSLVDHVLAVARALDREGLSAGRRVVARIVGRDPDKLDEAGVARAAIESAAESFSDGFLAPALWFAVLGLPGILIYKAVNTADSMIGHLDSRHRNFGWAAARSDDGLNWPAARLSALLIALVAPVAGGATGRALRIVLADAGRHASPNAGWPEAAMAGALDVRLGGPRRYDDEVVDTGTLNDAGRRAVTAADIYRANRVVVAAGGLAFIIVGGLAVLR